MNALILLACTTSEPEPAPPVEFPLPISLSRDPLPEGAIDVAISAAGVFVDHVESTDLKVIKGLPIALRVEATVPYETLFTVVEHLGDREISLVVAGSSGPAAIPLTAPDVMSQELDLTVLMSPEAFIGRTPEGTEAFPGHDHAGLRTWLTGLKADNRDSQRATLVPHGEASTEDLVTLADTVRAAGFDHIVLARAL